MPDIPTITEAIGAPTPVPVERFSPPRYPYLYACDYLRNHPQIVPPAVFESDERLWSARNEALWSRSTAAMIRDRWAELTGADSTQAAVQLADAYLTANRIDASDEDRILALAAKGLVS